MSREPVVTSLESVRRLTVTKQHLAGKLPAKPSDSAMLSVVRDAGFIQWDPVTIVAPSHLISFWARLGGFRPSSLDRLMWEEKKLFLHWTPMASIVLTEDYPIYLSLMRRYPDSLSKSWGSQRSQAKKFLDGHSALRKKILKELKGGPLLMSQFEDHARTKWEADDWNPGSDVEMMLYHLLMKGEVMVVGHEGAKNLWGLSDQFLPRGVHRRGLSEEEFEWDAAQRAIRALGTANPREIVLYFVRGRYRNISSTLERLEEEGAIHQIHIEGLSDKKVRYIHEADVPLLESMSTSAWEPRMSLLPPFDNMLGDTDRADRLFGFHYIREQFLPKEKRKFGTYVLPILWGEKFIGRIDPRLDKERQELVINAVHAEADAPADTDVADMIEETISRLAAFLGAGKVTYTKKVPKGWRRSLR